jgi:hypothetical protein
MPSPLLQKNHKPNLVSMPVPAHGSINRYSHDLVRLFELHNRAYTDQSIQNRRELFAEMYNLPQDRLNEKRE